MGWMGPGHTSMAMCSWMLMVGFSPLRCVMHAVQPGANSKNQKTEKIIKEKEYKQIHLPGPTPLTSLEEAGVVLGGCWWVDRSRWSVDGATLVYMEFSRRLFCLPVLSSDPDHAVWQPHTHYYLPSRSLLFLYPHTLPTSALPIREREHKSGVCVWKRERDCEGEGRD